jgi:preprotein translocase subunit YajC
MEFFISNAYAQQAAPQGSLIDLWPLVIIFIAFYFLLIRPQQKKQKAHNEMVAALQVGDEVMTAGGILGRITGVSDHYAVVQISDNTEIKVQKSSVAQVVPKGTFEEA